MSTKWKSLLAGLLGALSALLADRSVQSVMETHTSKDDERSRTGLLLNGQNERPISLDKRDSGDEHIRP